MDGGGCDVAGAVLAAWFLLRLRGCEEGAGVFDGGFLREVGGFRERVCVGSAGCPRL